MSCYFRHLKDVFDEAGMSVGKENKKRVDEFLHRHVGLREKYCPAAWRKLKDILADEAGARKKLVKALAKEFGDT